MAENYQDFGERYWQRFHEFRAIEAKELANNGSDNIADEAWRLLSDLEHAYAARSYSACFVLACAIIESHLRQCYGADKKFEKMMSLAGLNKKLKWLVDLRNAIMHGKPNPFVQYILLPSQQAELDKKCIDAFIAVHYVTSIKRSADL